MANPKWHAVPNRRLDHRYCVLSPATRGVLAGLEEFLSEDYTLTAPFPTIAGWLSIDRKVTRNALEAIAQSGLLLVECLDSGRYRVSLPKDHPARGGAHRLVGPTWQKLRADIFERDGHRCQYCGSSEQLECDHIKPLSKGGNNDPSNLITACRTCNRAKHSKTLQEMPQ